VFTRANDISSSRGLKSFRFCLASWVESHATTARQIYLSAADLNNIRGSTDSLLPAAVGCWRLPRFD
jgi:hypothetical protein